MPPYRIRPVISWLRLGLDPMEDFGTMQGKTRHRGSAFVGFFLVLVCSFPAWGLEPYSMEPVELSPKAALGHALVERLDSRGWLLFTYANGLKVSICEIFWVKSASMEEGSGGGSKSHYGDLEPGSLVGVIHFLPETDEDYREDFHDQKLAAGYYSMRYAPQPKGDPSDVLLLSPVTADLGAERVLSPDELERRSLLASGTRNPALLSLVSPELGEDKAPSLRMDDQGTCIFQIKLHVKSGAGSLRETRLAVILVTPRKGEGDAS
jgi:hypothetical protein